ncbi:MAG: nucleoside triphosphate pyrophosphohydrolase [Gammaproteobacteria bacterium]|nr:MAG: nucleoside triphosphate pyrophosphohydrolase [Gammaproteobacteria bacterium]
MEKCYTFEDLKEIMKELRQKCPWDRKQTHESLKKYLLEETYEVLDAIDRKDWQALKEELGDLLLQPIFHARIAEEQGKFNIDDVIDHLCRKLIERHPHVFGEEKANSAEEVLKNWEKRKLEKRNSVLEGVPKAMPALMRAEKLQKKASKVGFDWKNLSQVEEKVKEEWKEFWQALKEGKKEKIEHEFGDLLFALVNLARFLKIDPEQALQKANERFIKRFSYVEKRVKESGKKWEEFTLEELDRLWEEAKIRQEE